MKPIIAMFDNFFRAPEEVFESVVSGSFEDFKSPWDGVVYPGINSQLDQAITKYIHFRLEEILDRALVFNATFARLTTKALKPAPHNIHSDRIMGEYSMHIYMSKEWRAGSGTSLWCHHTEGHAHTEHTDVDVIRGDQNDPSKWTRSLLFQGEFNRAVIHDANLWHCAEPIGGWGDSSRNGRLVITTFFSGGGD